MTEFIPGKELSRGFFAIVYKRACRFARMVQRDRGEY